MSPQRISTITNIANQTVRNILGHLKSLEYVEHLGYSEYKITPLGLEQAKALSQASDVQSSGRTE